MTDSKHIPSDATSTETRHSADRRGGGVFAWRKASPSHRYPGMQLQLAHPPVMALEQGKWVPIRPLLDTTGDSSTSGKGLDSLVQEITAIREQLLRDEEQSKESMESLRDHVQRIDKQLAQHLNHPPGCRSPSSTLTSGLSTSYMERAEDRPTEREDEEHDFTLIHVSSSVSAGTSTTATSSSTPDVLAPVSVIASGSSSSTNTEEASSQWYSHAPVLHST